jgi:hypothetical protein
LHYCASFVTTFANLIGHQMYCARMEGASGYFDTNPILLIGPGQTNWITCEFGYHEVALAGAGDWNDSVFDACLQLDGDSDPTSDDPEHMALLPVNLPFDSTNGCSRLWDCYRARLATTNSCSQVTKNTASGVRRPIE